MKFPHSTSDFAVLDFGVFIVGSSTHNGGTHGIRVTHVPRVGPALTEKPWTWGTQGCPNTIVQSVLLRSEAFLIDAVERQYGIAESLF
jgi:hypothetical protein